MKRAEHRTTVWLIEHLVTLYIAVMVTVNVVLFYYYVVQQ